MKEEVIDTIDVIERIVTRAEEIKTLDCVDRCERLLRASRPDVEQFPDLKARWSELCRRVAVVRDWCVENLLQQLLG